MTVHALDDYYLAITLLITIGYQLFFFSIAWTFKFDKVTDFAGGTNFVVLAIITFLFGGTYNPRSIASTVLTIIWGLRLSGFLLFRILKTGSDDRFDDKRDQFFKFLSFWIFQMIWVWVVSLPTTVVNSAYVQGGAAVPFGTAKDIVGIILFAIGFIIESAADQTKYSFRVKRGNGQTETKFCNTGVWGWTRHPNYFGEILLWWGQWIMTLSVSSLGGTYRTLAYIAIFSPIFTTALLMFVSGLPLNERPTAEKYYKSGGTNWEQYQKYLQTTSILIPMPPAIWKRLPTFVKRTIGLELPFYAFDPEKSKATQGEDNSNHGESTHRDEESNVGLVNESQQSGK